MFRWTPLCSGQCHLLVNWKHIQEWVGTVAAVINHQVVVTKSVVTLTAVVVVVGLLVAESWGASGQSTDATEPAGCWCLALAAYKCCSTHLGVSSSKIGSLGCVCNIGQWSYVTADIHGFKLGHIIPLYPHFIQIHLFTQPVIRMNRSLKFIMITF